MKFVIPPVADGWHADDERALHHGGDPHEGRQTGAYIQTPPLLFTADGHSVWLGDMFRGRSCFLICGGPSVKALDLTKITRPGILTAGLNNSPATFRPNLWFEVDSPAHFLRSIWLDPTILKFAPLDHIDKRLFDSDAWKEMDVTVRECPAVFHYRRNEHFRANQYLWEDRVNWGDKGRPSDKDVKAGKAVIDPNRYYGGRSVMLAAVRILFYLGVRRLFLLGADFTMEEGKPGYHFDQAREAGSVKGNNESYAILNARFKELRPLFERERFFVFNCNPASRLEAFDKVTFDSAVKDVLEREFPVDPSKERTKGLYEREGKEKAERKAKEKAARQAKPATPPPAPPKGKDPGIIPIPGQEAAIEAMADRVLEIVNKRLAEGGVKG